MRALLVVDLREATEGGRRGLGNAMDEGHVIPPTICGALLWHQQKARPCSPRLLGLRPAGLGRRRRHLPQHPGLAAYSAAAQCCVESAAFGPACGGCRCRRIPTVTRTPRTIRATVVGLQSRPVAPTFRSWRTVQSSRCPVAGSDWRQDAPPPQAQQISPSECPRYYLLVLCAARGIRRCNSYASPGRSASTPRTCTAAVPQALQAKAKHAETGMS